MNSDDIDRAELRRLDAAATPGPWTVTPMGGIEQLHADYDGNTDVADANFIAAARTAVPALLDALEQAEARIQAVREEIGAWEHTLDTFQSGHIGRRATILAGMRRALNN